MSHSLVAYFSASGVTKDVAKIIADTIHGDLYEIEPLNHYTNADLDWMDSNSRSTKEMQDESSRPAMVKPLPSTINDYDTLFIGFPVWWDVEPRIVDTFLDQLNTTGLTIYVFATSGGSGINGSMQHLKKTYPTLNFKEGKLVNSRNVIQWINTIYHQ